MNEFITLLKSGKLLDTLEKGDYPNLESWMYMTEAMIINQALADNACNISKASKSIGVNRSTFQAKMKKFGFKLRLIDTGIANQGDEIANS